jgi:GT2 family glycosyltransferase
MFRKELIFKLPNKKLDERFFMYGEDHLWCWQIQQLGYVNYFYSETSIVHISGGSSSLKKQLQLRKTMMCHELDIMKLRKGSGVYFVVFAAIYSTKEYVRNFAKKVIFRLSGKLVR